MPFKDPENGRAFSRTYYSENKKKINGRTKAYNLAHPEKKRARGNAWRKAHPESGHTSERRWYTLRHSARKRGLLVEIAFEEFKNLTSLPCWYCGRMNPGKDFVGVDRVDSSMGYLRSNVVPCCTPCNEMKLDRSVDEWFSKMEEILAFSGRSL